MENPVFIHYDEENLGPINMELGASIALHMIEHWGLVAGVRGPDDSQGRAALELLSVDETVDRAFALADKFVARCQADGRLRDLGPLVNRRIMQQGYDVVRIVGVKDKSIEEEFATKKQ